jgi:hypothetical protein
MVGIPNGSNQKEFNLVTTKYNILLATGFVSQYILSYHGISRQPSGEAVDFKVNVPFVDEPEEGSTVVPETESTESTSMFHPRFIQISK